ncbi:iron-containing alcohol dehydrogenase family protein [Listeria floridensis]|nr:iron-containing alcohol dehydrogenase family protein [Listeria floridensis]
MTDELIVRGAPAEYSCGAGIWDTLPEHLERRGLRRVLVLHGTKSWKAVKSKFPDLSNFDATYLEYGGQVTYEARDLLAQQITADTNQAVIAVGGGKVADLAKAAAFVAAVPVLILPTLAATCAAYTPLSVMYTSEGEMIRFEIFPVSSALVLVDPEVILASPKALMVAGIGDTLAKWYEADIVISQLPERSVEIEIAAFAARKCRDDLLALSEAALLAMDRQELNAEFVKVVETNIMLAGMVGGFGDKYGRTAGAHSIHDALTLLPGTHRLLHGMKVAYGILIQLVIEGRFAEINALLPFYQKLGLPYSLGGIGLEGVSKADLMRVSERAAAPSEMIHLMPQDVDAACVYQAFLALEEHVAKVEVL